MHILIDPKIFSVEEEDTEAPEPEEPAPPPSAATAPCVVCLVLPKNTLFVPCGHVCCCENCAAILEAQGQENGDDNYLCPICRGVVTGRHKMFFA